MKTLFADTGYWISLLNPRDDLHFKARNLTNALLPFQTVTSEMIFAELLNAFSKQNPKLKQIATNLVRRSLGDANVDVIPQTSEIFHSALELYEQRLDQMWSLTDCASFQIMQQRNLTEALAFDRHFEQAGFIALLRQ